MVAWSIGEAGIGWKVVWGVILITIGGMWMKGIHWGSRCRMVQTSLMIGMAFCCGGWMRGMLAGMWWGIMVSGKWMLLGNGEDSGEIGGEESSSEEDRKKESDIEKDKIKRKEKKKKRKRKGIEIGKEKEKETKMK